MLACVLNSLFAACIECLTEVLHAVPIRAQLLQACNLCMQKPLLCDAGSDVLAPCCSLRQSWICCGHIDAG